MRIYSAKIRLAGSVLNEVRKLRLSAPEVMLLQSLHGSDSVLDIQETSDEKRKHGDERERLAGIYGAEAVVKIFGPALNPLPLRLELPKDEPEDDSDGEDGAPDPGILS